MRNLVYSGYESYLFSPFAHTTSKQCLLEALILNRIREVRDNCNCSFSGVQQRNIFHGVCVGGEGIYKDRCANPRGLPEVILPLGRLLIRGTKPATTNK